MGHPTRCLLPDFRARTGVVRFRVIQITKLVQHLAFTPFLHGQRQITSAFHTLLFGNQNQMRAVGFHRPTAFHRRVVRHDQCHFISHHRRCHGQGNPGIATGCFYQVITGLDIPPRLSTTDHRQGRTVFDRTRRIIAFQFEQHLIATRILSHALEPDQRRMTHAVSNGWIIEMLHTSTLFNNLMEYILRCSNPFKQYQFAMTIFHKLPQGFTTKASPAQAYFLYTRWSDQKDRH